MAAPGKTAGALGAFVAEQHERLVRDWERAWPPEIIPVPGLKPDPFGIAFWWAVWQAHYSYLHYASIDPLERCRMHLLREYNRAVQDALLQLAAGVPVARGFASLFQAGTRYRPIKFPRGPSPHQGKLRDAQRACMVHFLASRTELGLQASRGRETSAPFITACDAVALGEEACKTGTEVFQKEQEPRIGQVMLALLTFTPGLSATADIVQRATEEARHVVEVVDTSEEKPRFLASLQALEAHLSRTSQFAEPTHAAANIANVWYRHRKFLPQIPAHTPPRN